MNEPKTTPGASTSSSKSRVDLSSLIVIVVVLVAVGVAVFFSYRSSSLKTQLNQAQSELQKQRTQSESEINAATAKARESSDQLVALKSQVDLAKAEAASAKANAESASNQIADLQMQRDEARRQAADAKVNAEKALAEAAKLKEQLQNQPPAAMPGSDKPAQTETTGPAKPEAGSLKPLPLSVAITKAPLGNGNALALKNTSTGGLALTVKFSNTNGSREYELKLAQGAAKEMGWLGDWVLVSGDRIEIKSAGYETIVKTVP
jgi:hypothetical protein